MANPVLGIVGRGPVVAFDCGCRHWVEDGELVIDCDECDVHEPGEGYVDPRVKGEDDG